MGPLHQRAEFHICVAAKRARFRFTPLDSSADVKTLSAPGGQLARKLDERSEKLQPRVSQVVHSPKKQRSTLERVSTSNDRSRYRSQSHTTSQRRKSMRGRPRRAASDHGWEHVLHKEDPRRRSLRCECRRDHRAESVGLPQLGETPEGPITVGRGGVDQHACHVWGLTLPRGIDSLVYARCAVSTLECQLANEDVSERVQQDIRDPWKAVLRRRQFPCSSKCLVAFQQRSLSRRHFAERLPPTDVTAPDRSQSRQAAARH